MPLVCKSWSQSLLEPSGPVRCVQGLILQGGKNWILSVFIRVKTRNRTLCQGIMSRLCSILVFLSYVYFGHHNLLWKICSTELFIQLALFVLYSVKYRLGFKSRQGATDYVLPVAQTGCGAHPACSLVCTGGKNSWGEMLIIFLAPRWRVNGGIPPLPHSTSMAWIGATLHFLPFLPVERLHIKSYDCFQVRVLFV
jgi:hypothetical protein